MTSPIKARRTKAEIGAIEEAIYKALAADHPMTVRQVFYRLVTEGVIAKSENEYKATVCRLLVEMRLSGAVPFGWVADNTRWMRKPTTHSSLEAALLNTAQTYRRAIWPDQPVYVEIWLEKDALAGVLVEETKVWDVPLMVTRGYPSLSYLYEAAQAIGAEDKPAYLYYFGDYDPSGLDITRSTEARLRQFAPDADIHFERVAVTPEQIRDYNLPTRPTKQSDSRSKGFAGESVEVDALASTTLRQMARSCIEQHVDYSALTVLQAAEHSERLIIYKVYDSMKAA